MALPTQPNGSTDVRVQGSPLLGTSQLTLTAQSQLMVAQDTGSTVGLGKETGVIIIN